MKVKNEYLICDRCKDKINEHWYRRSKVTRLKRRLIVEGHAIEKEYDLCGKCTEKFSRFMNGEIDDDKPTEHEIYYQNKLHIT